jgi:hypothetical protein
MYAFVMAVMNLHELNVCQLFKGRTLACWLG